MEAIYCDACIYRDYYEWRPGIWLHHSEEAKKLFDRISNKEFTLVVSDHLAFQLQGFSEYILYIDTIRDNGNLIEISVTKKDKEKADEEAGRKNTVEFEDALHAELAIRGGASIFVTRDKLEHFGSYQEKIKIRQPELVGLF